VVIPLERLGEYTDAIERINIELSIRNKLELVDGLERHFSDAAAANGLADRRNEALELLGKVRSRWRYLLDSMDGAAPQGLSGSVFERLQDRSIRVSWKTELRAELEHLFVGESRAPMLAECDALHREVLKGRVFVALHMHAGDGNVHTNIPVNSDNYAMLQTANQAVARIMQIARALNGVISGEHGIGITKLEHLTDAELADFRGYKARVDPEGRFNQHKLMPGSDLRRAYTPSFGLMNHESLIMQQSDISSISDAIKDCLRCGKCKPVCSTHVPAPTSCTLRATRFWPHRC